MNREILFKAKRKDNGEWVEGLPTRMWGTLHIQDSDDENTAYEINPDTLCQYTGMNDNTEWKNLTETEKESFLSNWNYKENRKNKIEDWEGKRIWENDIVRGHGNDEDLARVVFGEFNVIDIETLEAVDRVIGWHTEVIETDALSKCEPFCLAMPLTDFYIEISELEVFGNVFDNPELLEVEE